MKRLANKTALITGSTRGIGAALAVGFAAEGAHVIVHGRREDDARRGAEEAGGSWVIADLGSERGAEELAREVAARHKKLDILVNNAGREVVMPIGKIDFGAFDEIWRINVRAAVQLTQGLLPLLRAAAPASVINMTSIHDAVPYPHNAAYSMSKAALGMFTRVAAVELAPLGIRVNNFAPGAVETDINREIVEAMRAEFAEWIPAGRVAQCEDMLGPALFLASEESRYVTGATLYADGGYMQNLVRYRALS